jgi:hypothetical protein
VKFVVVMNINSLVFFSERALLGTAVKIRSCGKGGNSLVAQLL